MIGYERDDKGEEIIEALTEEEKKLMDLVDQFCWQMKYKLIQKGREGKSGWDDPHWLKSDIKMQLKNHIDKGDPVDIANFSMFLWNRIKNEK